MLKPTDAPVPFTYRREIFWGDTDTALIVYTGRFLDYSLEAIEAWFRATLGIDWYAMNVDLGIGTPYVHVDIDFVSPLTPRDVLEVRVHVASIGRSSLGFTVTGYANGERLSFRGTMVSAFVNIKTMAKIPIPDEYRTKIVAYRDAHAGEVA
jgi:4-hydroxybenzoyl-CoA thioesterase